MDNNQNGPNNGPGNRKGPKNGQTIIIFLIVTVITLIVMALFNSMMNGTTNQEITYNKFMEMLDNDEVESVVIESNQYVITPKQQPYGFSSLKGMKFTYYTGVVNGFTHMVIHPEMLDNIISRNNTSITARSAGKLTNRQITTTMVVDRIYSLLISQLV